MRVVPGGGGIAGTKPHTSPRSPGLPGIQAELSRSPAAHTPWAPRTLPSSLVFILGPPPLPVPRGVCARLSLSSPPRQRGKSRMEGGQVEPATSNREDCLLNWTFRLRSGAEVHSAHPHPAPTIKHMEMSVSWAGVGLSGFHPPGPGGSEPACS